MEHYGENGAGFYLDSRKYSIWYNAEGIHVAEGETAQRTAATLIPWEQAAKRIRELLDLGRYMPQSELDRVDGYERQQRAAQLWYLRQDFAEETADAGFLPTINAIYNTHQGFPEESAAISDLLGHPEGLQNLRDELEQFVQAYAENRELLRFHFNRHKNCWNSLPIYNESRCILPPPRDMIPSGVSSSPAMRSTISCAVERAARTIGWRCTPFIATTLIGRNEKIS